MAAFRIKALLILVVAAAVIAGCAGQETMLIGITQIEEHPALDAARQGFIDGLAEAGYVQGENIRIEYQSAQGEVGNAQLIAESFVAKDSDLILAISTPSAQMTFQATKEIPIMITAVTDPIQEGLAESWTRSSTNVTGTSDMAPIDKHVDLIRKLLPGAVRIGVIYNTSEPNSEVQVHKLTEHAGAFGLEVVPAGVTSIGDIQIVLEALLPQVDVLYMPTDNLVVSSMGLVVETANAHGIPIVGSEESQVTAGALATQGIDYYQLGLETAQMAVQVMEGASPAEMPIRTLQETQLLINSAAAETLGVEIPQALADSAEFVGGEQ